MTFELLTAASEFHSALPPGLATPTGFFLMVQQFFTFGIFYALLQRAVFERMDRLDGRLLDWSWTWSEVAFGMAAMNALVSVGLSEMMERGVWPGFGITWQLGILVWSWLLAGLVWLLFAWLDA